MEYTFPLSFVFYIFSWPEFLSFLEISQQMAWKKHPELEELPRKLRAKTPVVPDPIEGLSEHTRNKLVNKLLKKVHVCMSEIVQNTSQIRQEIIYKGKLVVFTVST